jgi:Secretion system C-terminal sorting domain
MKIAIISTMVLFMLVGFAHADLGGSWEVVHGGDLRHIEQLIPLGNGSFLCIVKYENMDPYSVLHIDQEGGIVSEYHLDTNEAIIGCTAVDGGAYTLVQRTSIVKWDADGNIVESSPWEHGRVFAMNQEPDESIICLQSFYAFAVSNTFEFMWRTRLGSEPYDVAYLKELIRLHSGRYFTIGHHEDYSFSGNYTWLFKATGEPLRSPHIYHFNHSLCDSQYDQGFVRIEWWAESVYWCNVVKENHWSLSLPTFLEMASYYHLNAFNDEHGYLVMGSAYTPGMTGILAEISEDGSLGEVHEIPQRRFATSAQALDGSILCAAYNYEIPNIRRLALAKVHVEHEGIPALHLPIDVDLMLHDAPRHLPPDGGLLLYHLLIKNDLSFERLVTLELTVTGPDGNEFVADSVEYTLEPGSPVVIPRRSVHIPGQREPGEYTLTAKVLDTEEGLVSQSRQNFRVNASMETSIEALDTEELAEIQPIGCTLREAYPNPFNAETRISLTLPQPAEVSVIVYDIQGRIVATLAYNETREAGTHDFTLNGSELASGLYFVQATVPGQMNEVRKLVLVK